MNIFDYIDIEKLEYVRIKRNIKHNTNVRIKKSNVVDINILSDRNNRIILTEWNILHNYDILLLLTTYDYILIVYQKFKNIDMLMHCHETDD